MADNYAVALQALRSIAANACCAQCREAGLVARSALQTMGEPLTINAVDPSAQPQERGERATPDRRDSSDLPSTGAPLGDAPRAELVELVEEFCGWWHLNREGSVNRTYDYIDKLVKQLRAAAGVGGAPEE